MSYDPEDHKTLLKVHYGVSFNDSDSESGSSIESNDSEMERYRPDPLSYEEIRERILVIKAKSYVDNEAPSTSSDFDNPDLAILQKLLTLETCNLCHVPLKSSEEVKKHYRSKSHENLVIYWFGQVLLEKSRTFLNESVYEEYETNDQHNKNNIRSYANITKKSLGSTTSSTNKNTKNKAVETKLKSLTQPFYCHICPADLQTPKHAMAHYSSQKHAQKIEKWHKENGDVTAEISITNTGNMVSIDNNIEEDEIQELVNELSQPVFCFICKVNLGAKTVKAKTHYDSELHTMTENLCKQKIKKLMKNQDHQAISNTTSDSITAHDIVQDELKELMQLKHCYICKAKLNQPTVAKSHYDSKRHANNVDERYRQELKTFSLIQDKLNKLVRPFYCFLCQTNLKQSGKAEKHYNSKTHTKMIKFWQKNKKISMFQNPRNKNSSINTSTLTLTASNNRLDSNLSYLKTPQDIFQEKLNKLCQPLYCYLCQADLKQPGIASQHYNSKKHLKKINAWEENEKQNISHNLKNEETVSSSSSILIKEVKNISVDALIQEKLSNLTQPLCCYLCQVNLKLPGNAQAHYNSKKHSRIVNFWQEEERKRMTENLKNKKSFCKSSRSSNDVLNTCRELQEVNTSFSLVQNVTQDNFIKDSPSLEMEEVKSIQDVIQEKLNKLAQPHYCYLCLADVKAPKNAQSHYNSQKHANKVISWKEKEKKSITKNYISNISPNSREQEIITTSSPDQHVTEDNINKSVNLYNWNDFWWNMNSSFTREEVKRKAAQYIIEEKLNTLIQPLYCFLCQADLNTPGNAESHYNSQKHTNEVIAWKEREKKSMTEKNLLNAGPYRKAQEIPNTSSSVQHVTEDNINKSVKLYSGCDFWCNMETDNQEVEGFTHIMTSSKENSSFKREDVKIIAPQNIIEEELNKLIQPLYCFLCQADLIAPGNAESHYNSRKHTNKVIAWIEKEKKSMTENDLLNASPYSKVQEILNTSVPVQHVTGDKTKKLDNQINGVPQIMPSSSTESSSVNKAEVKDVPDNEVIQEEVTKPFYCSMCQVDFRAAVNAQSHYNSRKHLKKLNSCQKKEESITEMDVLNTCKVDEVNISFSPVQQVAQIDQTSLENKLFDDADIETFHADLTRTFNIDIKKQLFDLLTEENCRICDILLSNQNSSKYHYLSKKHGKKIQQWHQNYQTDCQMEVVEGTVPQCDDSLPTTITLYCYICKCTFSTEELRKQHIQDLIHQGQLKVIIVLIKKEVPLHDEWFNLVRNVVQYDRCNMCLQRFSAFTSEAFEHINSPSFTDEIEMWIDQQKNRIPNDVFENVDTKVYYCEVCDAKLDGTTRTALHYTGKKHEESLQTYCQLCQLRLLTIENYEAHLQSPQHLEISAANEEKVTEETICLGLDHANKHESNPQISYKDTLEPDLSKNDLDDKLLQELEKLTDALYYSKNIPLERALKFIQKFNKELAQDIQENMEMLLSVDNKTDIKEASVLKTNFEEENLAFSSKSYRGAINNLEPVEIFVDNSNHNIKEETSVSVECNQVCEQNVVVCSPDHNLSKQLNESPLEKNKIIAIEESTLDLHINNTREGLIRDDLNQVEIIDDLNHNIKEETKECVKKSSKKKRRKRKQLENSDNVECNEVSEQNIFISPDYNISKELSEIRSHLEVNQIKTIIKESTSDSHINNLREGPIGEDLKRVEIIDLDDSNHNIVEENEVVDKKSCKRKRVRRGGRGRRKLLETGDNDECNQSCSEKDTNTSQDQNISKINIHTETDDIGINSEANTTVSYEANILKPDTISMKRIEGCLSLKQKVSRELTYEMIAQGILDNRYFNKDHYRPINLDKTIDYNVDASTSKSAEIDFDASSSEQSQQGSFTEDEIQEKENGYCNEQTKTEEKRICRIS